MTAIAPGLSALLKPVPEWLALNPDIDVAAARTAFEPKGRVHLKDVLAPEAAEKLRNSLATEGLWARSTIFKGEPREFDLDWLAALPAADQAAMRAEMDGRARYGFQYEFDNFRLADAALAGVRFGQAYEHVFDLLNSPEFIGLAKAVTGDDRIRYLDAQTTRYRPGHFLTSHDDDKPGQDRLYAYVLGFTRGWRPDWGGLLAFIGPDGHVEEAWTPAFNTLNIFRVPTLHAVTTVSPFAGGERLSITGWMRSTDPTTIPIA